MAARHTRLLGAFLPSSGEVAIVGKETAAAAVARFNSSRREIVRGCMVGFLDLAE